MKWSVVFGALIWIVVIILWVFSGSTPSDEEKKLNRACPPNSLKPGQVCVCESNEAAQVSCRKIHRESHPRSGVDHYA